MTLRTSIPIVLTSFVGRKRELVDIAAVLTSSRLATLVGAAGCGKTHLALRVAAESGRHYDDGVHRVVLTRQLDPSLVPQAVARASQMTEPRGRPTIEGLLDALQHQWRQNLTSLWYRVYWYHLVI